LLTSKLKFPSEQRNLIGLCTQSLSQCVKLGYKLNLALLLGLKQPVGYSQPLSEFRDYFLIVSCFSGLALECLLKCIPELLYLLLCQTSQLTLSINFQERSFLCTLQALFGSF